MYSLLIVDDEPLVQVGLQSMIDWQALDARLLPCASNGQAALAIIKQEHPDLVITDIRMPLMDGLELIRRCRTEMDPSPEFVVLTSYEDFAFAREAMKHQVVDYLIKLEITPEILRQTFAKARQLIDAKQTRITHPEATDPGQAFRDRMLFGLLDRSCGTEAQAQEGLRELGIELQGQYYLAATCRLLDEPEDGLAAGKGELHTYFYTIKMVREILGREYNLQALPYSRNQFILLVAGAQPGRDLPTAEARFQASLDNSLEMAHRYFNCVVQAGLGTAAASLLSLAESYRESLQALEACGGPVRLVQFRNLGNQAAPALSGESFRKHLERALAGRDATALRDSLRLARSDIEGHGKLSIALDLCAAALHSVLSTQNEAEHVLNGCFPDHPDGYKCLYSIPNLPHVLAWLEQLETGLVANLENQNGNFQENLVQAMKKHVEAHYKERLQLKSVAEHFKLSPNYAGVLFRKYAGIGFSEFVAEVKIAQAKNLIASRKYRMYEVADILGFENSYYFSKVFRRVTGLSPREFRGHPDDKDD